MAAGDGQDEPLKPGYYKNSKGETQLFSPDRYAANPFSLDSDNPDEVRRAQQYRDAVDRAAFDNAGKPVQKPFESALGDDGRIKDIYRVDGKGIDMPNINQSGIEAMRARATGTGPSPWLNLQLDQQKAKEANQMDQATAQNQGQAAAARSGLAMRGGLSSGANERIARSQMMGGNQAAQGIRQAGDQERMGLQIADEGQRMDMLKGLPAAEIANAMPGIDAQKFNVTQDFNTQKTNVGSALNDLLQKRAYDSNSYNEAMRAWAAGKSADAQANAGKK
jgi:hypothetical protein